jgi:hypothetical protein
MRSALRPLGPRAIAALAAAGVTIAVLALQSSQESADVSAGPHVYGCPIFPASNQLNQDISQAPVAPRSSEYIAAIGTTLHLYADFGPGPNEGMPYTVVGKHQPKVTVQFNEYG